MKSKIENPKVFISYAWGDKDYQDKVTSFVSSLMQNGVDVIYDKFDLVEGHDTYAFMEQSVNDPTVTNVLILLDPVYAEKANEHKGGVGTETQIISPQVYEKNNQDKFLPIVFERNSNGDVCKPTYLQGRLHFDLSIAESYDEQYQRLVKRLYGVEIYEKPSLGKKPDWVEKNEVVPIKTVIAFDGLKKDLSTKVRKEQFIGFLGQIKDKICTCTAGMSRNGSNAEYIDKYKSIQSIRDEYLALLKNASYIDNFEPLLSDFLEETENSLETASNFFPDLLKTLLHEMFLYTIAILIKNKNYDSVGKILKRTYFCKTNPDSYHIFYSGSVHENLDNAMKNVDNKNYYSGTAQLWMVTINTEFCSKKDFVFADLFCFNYSLLNIKPSLWSWHWFPETYIYDDPYNSVLSYFALKLVSKERLNEYLPMLGFTSIEDFRKKYIQIEAEMHNGSLREYRYNSAFDSAPLLCSFLASDKLGSID